jgi:putative hemolysin
MDVPQVKPIFKVNLPSKGLFSNRVASLASGALEQLLALNKLDEIYARCTGETDPRRFLDRVLGEFRVRSRVSSKDLEAVPRQGPALVVANNPFGGIEGIVLAHQLLGVRRGVKIMANHLLSRIPELREIFIFVDPFDTSQSITTNLRPLKEAIRWVEAGNLLAVFPAGEVAHLDLKARTVTDPPWSRVVARLAARTKSPVIPAFFSGANGHLFQVMGLVHPRLRTALLPRELLNKADKKLSLKLGGPIPPERLAELEDEEALTAYLRWRTYTLAGKEKKLVKGARRAVRQARKVESQPISAPPARELVSADVAGLAPEQTLVKAGKFRIIHATRDQIPNLMIEIGRLREITFRQVGEGTGKPLDLDGFDEYYRHLCLWNDKEEELVGAYRLGMADRIVREQGLPGLYTSTLFKYKPDFFAKIGSALELGRSFIRAEYQRSYSSLLLLWKGIGRFILQNPRYRYVFGPVSVSANYSPLSRLLMVDYVEINHSSDLSWLVKPRKPARLKIRKGFDHRSFMANLSDPEVLSEVISDIEGRGPGVPVLLRHYLNLSAKAAGWNVDPEFGQVLDCLMVVDLLETDPKTMNHYLGPEGYRTFLAYHGKSLDGVSEAA